jgi:hypothetical protein
MLLLGDSSGLSRLLQSEYLFAQSYCDRCTSWKLCFCIQFRQSSVEILANVMIWFFTWHTINPFGMQVSRSLEQRLTNLRLRFLRFRAWRFRLHRKDALLGLKPGISGWG